MLLLQFLLHYSWSLFWFLLITEGAPSRLLWSSNFACRNHLIGTPTIFEINFSLPRCAQHWRQSVEFVGHDLNTLRLHQLMSERKRGRTQTILEALPLHVIDKRRQLANISGFLPCLRKESPPTLCSYKGWKCLLLSASQLTQQTPSWVSKNDFICDETWKIMAKHDLNSEIRLMGK